MRVRSREQPTERRLSVEVIHVEGPKFLTIEEHHPIWGNPEKMPLDMTGVRFIRIRPPMQASDEEVEAVRRFFIVAASVQVDVQVLPRARPQVVLEQAETNEEEEDHGLRETCITMVEEANTQDRGALRSVVEENLAAVGL